MERPSIFGAIFAACVAVQAFGLARLEAQDLDALIADLRQDHFNESSHNSPGISLDDINEDFVKQLYSQDGAVDALAHILADRNYWDINMRIGEIRNRANVRIWMDIVQKYGIRVEFNNAGKMNGAISDLDQTHFTDANQIVDADGKVLAEGSQAVHQFLLKEFTTRFTAEMGKDPGKGYDMMHFAGDGMMADWRLSDSKWAQFLVELDNSIEALTKTEGAYFIPGAYKTQVYTRYLSEGRTIVLEPQALAKGEGKTMKIPGYGDVPLRDGVALQYGLTRKLSKLYKGVPGEVDRTGALGSLLENSYHADHQKTNKTKQAKYEGREVNTALVHLTNLEVDFQQLLLEGRDGARAYFIEKIFSDFEGELPPGIESLDDIQRILEIQQRIELDKIIKGSPPPGERPTTWADKWQSYQVKNINDTDTKLDYYAVEVKEILETLRRFEADIDMNDPETRARVADMAEGSYQDKLRTVGHLAAVKTAQKVLADVFTREGFARQKYLHGAEPARRLLAEQVRGLHAAMVFIDDPDLIRVVIDNAPEETRAAFEQLEAIARAQRLEIIGRRGAVETIEAGELKASNGVLLDLLKQLDIPNSEKTLIAETRQVPNVPGLTRFATSVHTDDRSWVHRKMTDILLQAVIDGYGDGQTIQSRTVGQMIADPTGTARDFALETYVFNVHQTGEFFKTTLPAMFEFRAEMKLGLFGTEYLKSFKDIGTVDSAAKIAAAYATGKPEAMRQEIRDSVLGGVPIGGQLFNFAKNLKAYQDQGAVFPLAAQISTQGLKLFPNGGPYSAMLGHVMVYYSLANTLYDVGWYFYGQPTQSDVVSLVLTGKPGVVPTMGSQSRLPAFEDQRTWDLLKANALLDQHVPVMDLPRDYREEVLKNFFLREANQHVTSGQGLDIGYVRTWEAARDEHLRDKYYQNWRYWFQRLYFYHEVHLDLFRSMSQRVGNTNWQAIDNQPPSVLEGATQSQLLAEYGDAFTRTQDGGYWDHERVWLRRYFQGWLIDWEKAWEAANQDHGEFFMLMDGSFIAGDWRKAVVDELIRYYLEGEAFYNNQPDGLDAHQKQAAAAHEQAMKNLEGDLVKEIANEAGQEAQERMEAMEKLFWHPAIQEKILKAMEQAAERQPDFKPEKPALSAQVPRPVARLGQEIPLGFVITGDPNEIPDDIQVTVNYRKVSDETGRRPEAVLKDDIRTFFRVDLKDEELRVVTHDAVITATSPSVPGLRLEDTARLYWLAYADPDKEEAENEGDDPDRDGTSTEDENMGWSILEQLRELTERAEAEGSVAAAECARGQEALGTLTGVIGNVKSGLAEIEALVADLEQRAAALSTALDDAEAGQAKVRKLAEELAALRDSVGQAALKTCETTRAMQISKDPEERKTLLAEVRVAFEETEKGAQKAEEVYAELKAEAAKVRGLHQEMTALGVGEVMARVEEMRSEFASGDGLLAIAEEAQAAVSGSLGTIQGLHGQADALAATNPDPGVQDQVDAYLGRISAAEKRVETCVVSLTEGAGKAKTSYEELPPLIDAMEQRIGALGLEGGDGDLPAKVAAVLKDTEATEAVADIFIESIRDYLAQARHCLGLAERIALEPLMTAVPDVLNQSVEDARGLLAAARFEVALAGGDSAPSMDLAFHVQGQDPAPGSQAAIGSTVTVRVYGKPTAVVPSVTGLPAADARSRITAAGLVPVLQGGDPAPTEAQSFMVASQSPGPGETVNPGTEVTFAVYGKYKPAMTAVPRVVGLDVAAARAAVAGAGFQPALQGGDAAPSEELSFRVFSQNPPAGEMAEPGAPVAFIVYGKYEPSMTRVPAVVGLKAAEAKAAITGAGFQATFAGGDPAPSAEKEGVVYSQFPAPGTESKPGSAVKAVIYSKAAMTSPVPTRPEPPAMTGPPAGEEEGKPYLVVFNIAFPANLEEVMGPLLEDEPEPQTPATPDSEKPSSLGELMADLTDFGDDEADTARFQEALKKVNVNQLRFEALPDSPMLFYIGGEGVKTYPREMFTEGRKFSCPIRFSGVSNGQSIDFSGAFLFQCVRTFNTLEEVKAAYPGKKVTDSLAESTGEGMGLSKIESKDGTFTMKNQDASGQGVMTGGPFVEGWPVEMKRAFMDMMAMMCSMQTAYEGTEFGTEKIALLRRFRDEVLMKSEEGHAVIEFYYGKFSPWAQDVMRDHPWSRGIFRHGFDRLAGGVQQIEKGNPVTENLWKAGVAVSGGLLKENEASQSIEEMVADVRDKD